MADKEKKDYYGKLCSINICVAENGFNIRCCYEAEKSLSQRAGWVPCSMGECKEYVAKSKGDLTKKLEEILNEKN
jgi:uncharacterized membrane protein